MHNTTIILDIETIPASNPAIRDYITKTVKHPGTIKLPASIEKWNENERPAAIDEAVNKTGLDGAFGQVCCIGYDLLNDGNPQAIYGLDEAQLLCDFNEVLDGIPVNMWSAVVIAGHNVSGFDLRFLLQRYIVNGIRPHAIINHAAQAKSWDDCVYDTMTKFAGHGNRISLDKLCMALGVPTPKGDMDGSMVGQYVADGRIDEVADYCKKDVAATRAVYRRMTFSTPIDQPVTTEMQPEENTPEPAPALSIIAQVATETIADTAALVTHEAVVEIMMPVTVIEAMNPAPNPGKELLEAMGVKVLDVTDKAAPTHVSLAPEAIELRAEQAMPEGAYLSPAAQALNESEGAVRYAKAHTPPELKLGQMAERLGFTLTAAFLLELGFEHSATDKAAKLYHESEWPLICAALIERIENACELVAA